MKINYQIKALIYGLIMLGLILVADWHKVTSLPLITLISSLCYILFCSILITLASGFFNID